MLELDIGLICACLLAFPAFIDRYGPGLMKRLASYSIRRRSTTRKISASSKEGSSSGNGRIFKHCSSDEYAKLAEGTSGTMMHDITPEIADHSCHSNHRAKLEYEDAFQSLQSPQTLASAHIVWMKLDLNQSISKKRIKALIWMMRVRAPGWSKEWKMNCGLVRES